MFRKVFLFREFKDPSQGRCTGKLRAWGGKAWGVPRVVSWALNLVPQLMGP